MDVDWLKVNINEMAVGEMFEYFEWSNRSSCRLAHDFGGQILNNSSGIDGQKAICAFNLVICRLRQASAWCIRSESIATGHLTKRWRDTDAKSTLSIRR